MVFPKKKMINGGYISISEIMNYLNDQSIFFFFFLIDNRSLFLSKKRRKKKKFINEEKRNNVFTMVNPLHL